jgi:TonB-linked SusC/RagA family outer membrane protein
MHFSNKAGAEISCAEMTVPRSCLWRRFKPIFFSSHSFKTAFKVLKLTCFILLAAFLQVSARGYAQKVKVVGQNMTMKQVFEKIEDQTGFGVFIDHDLLVSLRPVTLNEKESSLDNVLNKCFQYQATPLGYSISNRTISIYKKGPENSPSQIAPQATIDVSGKITDSAGAPLAGAIIQLAGANKSTTTDDQGVFKINGISPDAVLVVSFVGFTTRRIEVQGRTSIGVTLQISSRQMAAVVLEFNNGYGAVSQARTSGSYALVDNKLFNRSVNTDVISHLEGVVPGLLFNRNTSSGVELSIRGSSTLFSNNQPLIVVDNFPYDGDINNINPNDILSVTVLKDAAAASIWGVKSGNGVIVITTKKGKKGQPMAIEANVSTTLSQKQDLYYSRNFLPSSDFIPVEQNLFNKGYYDAQLTDPAQPPVSPIVQALANVRNGITSQSEADDLINANKKIDVRHQLSKYFYQQALTQRYAVNIRGGSDKTAYFFSAGYDKDRMGLVGNKNNRFTLLGNTDFLLTKQLTFTVGINYVRTSSVSNSPVPNITAGGIHQAIYPYAQFVGSNGQAAAIVKDYNLSWVDNSSVQAGLLDWHFRPLDELRFAENSASTLDNRINLGLKYNLPFGLKFSSLYQYEIEKGNTENYYSDSTYFARNLVNSFAQSNAGSWSFPIPIGGVLQQSQSDLTAHHFRAQLENIYLIDAENQWNAILGAEISQSITRSVSSPTTYGYDKSNDSYQNVNYVDYFPNNPNIYNSSQIPGGPSFYKFTDRYISYYGNLSYTYKGLYTFTGSGRIDKSNLFGVETNRKSVPLYSLGVLWDLAREKFFKISWLPIIRLRATYGLNGNVNKSATAVTTLNELSNNQYFGLPFAQVVYPGNPDLRWERIQVSNIGLDFGVRDNLISGTIEYYRKKGTNLFSNAPLPPSTGWPVYYGNTANIKGNGIDITLNSRLVNSRNFQWNSTFIISRSVEKVTKYLDVTPTSLFIVANASSSTIAPTVGRPIYSLYAYKFAGLSHDSGDPQGYIDGKASTDYSTIISNAKVDSLHFIGSARPTVYGSWRNAISFKGITLSANVIFKMNYYFKRSSISYGGLFNGWVGNMDFLKRWQQPGDEHRTNIPSMPTEVTNFDPNRDSFFNNSDALATKGDHIRLQDITISYDMNSGFLLKRGIQSARLYAYVNNIGILWRANRQGLDPDVFLGAMPNPRTYSLGINLGF